MRCNLCGSDSHLQRNFHPGAVQQHARNRLAAGVQPVHIIGDLVNELEAVHQMTDTANPGNDEIEESVADQLNLFDAVTEDVDESEVQQETPAQIDLNFYNDVDKDCITNHIAAAIHTKVNGDDIHSSNFQ